MFTLRDGIVALDEFNCFVKVENNNIYIAPMDDNGCLSEEPDWSMLEEPTEDFIKAVRFSS